MTNWFDNFMKFIGSSAFWGVILLASFIFVIAGSFLGSYVPAIAKLRPSLFFMIALIWISILIAWKLIFSGLEIIQQKQIFPFILAIVIVFALFYILIVHGNVNISNMFSSVNLQSEGKTLMAVFTP